MNVNNVVTRSAVRTTPTTKRRRRPLQHNATAAGASETRRFVFGVYPRRVVRGPRGRFRFRSVRNDRRTRVITQQKRRRFGDGKYFKTARTKRVSGADRSGPTAAVRRAPSVDDATLRVLRARVSRVYTHDCCAHAAASVCQTWTRPVRFYGGAQFLPRTYPYRRILSRHGRVPVSLRPRVHLQQQQQQQRRVVACD